MKLGVACDGWVIVSSDDIEEIAKLQCEPVEHEGCSVCDPLEIITGIPCYKTVFVDELPDTGISGILYVTKTDDEYSIYEWDGSIFVNVTSPASCTLQTKTVTPAASQVEYLPDSGYDGFDKVTVEAIPSEYIVPSGTKNITANGNNQDVKAYEKVNVNVPNSYSAADEGKVVQSGALVSQSSATYTENGTYDTTLKNEVVVDVQSGGGDPNENLIKANNNTLASFSDPNLTYIRSYMFYNCSSLKSIDLPSLTGIGSDAFRGCDLTGDMSFENYLSALMINAFRANTHMTSVTFKKGIIRADTSVFEGCSNLAVIDIGDWGSASILNISGTGFYNTPNITALIIRGGTVFPLASSFPANSALSNTATIYVPQSLVATYQAATNWSTYASRITKIEGTQYENYYADGSPVT